MPYGIFPTTRFRLKCVFWLAAVLRFLCGFILNWLLILCSHAAGPTIMKKAPFREPTLDRSCPLIISHVNSGRHESSIKRASDRKATFTPNPDSDFLRHGNILRVLRMTRHSIRKQPPLNGKLIN